MAEWQTRPRWHVVALLLVLLSLAFVAAAARSGRAQETSDLYQATAIVTGSDMRSARPDSRNACARFW